MSNAAFLQRKEGLEKFSYKNQTPYNDPLILQPRWLGLVSKKPIHPILLSKMPFIYGFKNPSLSVSGYIPMLKNYS